jgi:hypothetical protein
MVAQIIFSSEKYERTKLNTKTKVVHELNKLPISSIETY